MTKKEYKKECKYILDHCDDFINDVHKYMVNTGWTWVMIDGIPDVDEIRKALIDLLTGLEDGSTYTSCGGFSIFVNKDRGRIECYFGKDSMKREGLSLMSPGVKDDVLYFIDCICNAYPILNREDMVKRYTEWKKSNP